MEVQIPMDLHGRHNRTITCQGIGGIRPRTGSGGRMRQGWGEAPRAKPLERGGTRKATPAFFLAWPAERERPERQTERSLWLRQRNAKDPKGNPSVPPGFASGTRKKSPLPVWEKKPFPRKAPAATKVRPIHRGIWVRDRMAHPSAARVAQGAGLGLQHGESPLIRAPLALPEGAVGFPFGLLPRFSLVEHPEHRFAATPRGGQPPHGNPMNQFDTSVIPSFCRSARGGRPPPRAANTPKTQKQKRIHASPRLPSPILKVLRRSGPAEMRGAALLDTAALARPHGGTDGRLLTGVEPS